MVRSRENLHVIYVLLFLEAALFLLQMQDGQRYVQMFAFVPQLFLAGEVWRIFTYQFMQGGALGLFFALLILYIMGNALEEEWGTFDFVVFWLLSVLGSATVAMILGVPIYGSFFLSYSLLFAYALTYPEMTFLLFFVLPVKVKWLAWIALAILIFGLLRAQPNSIAAAGGAAASLMYFRMRQGGRLRIRMPPRAARPPLERPPIDPSDEKLAGRNLALFAEVEEALERGDREEVESLIRRTENQIVPGVNICPPPDYKPKGEDRYCIRCEGFAECTVRFMRASSEASTVEQGEPDRAGSR
ncbi:MAG TPA: rhomboid family intramembrane serine protease [Thermoanaerobaculia bacterium]|nr:rhomboid family intramembrane serine protease [Thermoanaerobaculia bacterium]